MIHRQMDRVFLHFGMSGYILLYSTEKLTLTLIQVLHCIKLTRAVQSNQKPITDTVKVVIRSSILLAHVIAQIISSVVVAALGVRVSVTPHVAFITVWTTLCMHVYKAISTTTGNDCRSEETAKHFNGSLSCVNSHSLQQWCACEYSNTYTVQLKSLMMKCATLGAS